MKRILAVCAALGIVVLGCGGASSSSPPASTAPASSEAPSASAAGTPETTDLTVYAVKDPQIAAQLAVADDQQIFATYGLNVKTTFLASGSEVAPGFASGNIQIGMASSMAMIATVASGFPVKLIGRISDVSGGMGIVVNKSLGTDPKSLEGKKLGLINAPPSLVLLHDFTQKYGVDQSKITIVNFTAPADLLTAFVSNNVDAVLIWNPAFTQAQQQGGLPLVSGTVSYVNGTSAKDALFSVPIGIYVSSDFASKNPNTVVAVLRALNDATQWINANQDGTTAILSKLLGTSPDLTKTMVQENTYTMVVDQSVLDNLDQQTQFVYQSNLIKTAPQASSYLDLRYLRDVDPSLVKVTP